MSDSLPSHLLQKYSYVKIEIYETIILPVVLYWCEILYHIKGRLNFENEVLIIF
jgi:hypothetical protein